MEASSFRNCGTGNEEPIIAGRRDDDDTVVVNGCTCFGAQACDGHGAVDAEVTTCGAEEATTSAGARKAPESFRKLQ